LGILPKTVYFAGFNMFHHFGVCK